MLRLRIQPLSSDQVLAYLKTLAIVATADGPADDAERALFEAAMAEYDLPAVARGLVRATLEQPVPVDIDLRRLEDAAVRRLILRDAHLMAWADGGVSAAEKARLEAIREALRLPAADADAADAWASEGLAWLERGDEMVGFPPQRRRAMF